MRNRLLLMGLMSALVCGAATAQDAPQLRQFTVVTTGPAEITLPFPQAPENPMLRDGSGQWLPCPVQYADGRVTLSIGPEAGGRVVVLLSKPAWLNLEDQEPPAVTSVSVDAQAVELAEGAVKLGHLGAPPKAITVQVADQENPLSVESLVVTLNGSPLSAEGEQLRVERADELGKRIAVSVSPGDLPEGDYALELRVSDASVDRWPVKLTVGFSTAPILANGSFEQGEVGKCPERWGCGDWGSDEATKYEVGVAEGGRTGEHCLMLNGIAGKLNVITHQTVDFLAGRSYVLRGYHRGARGGYASMITRVGSEQPQYLNMPALPAAEDWTPFEWEFTVEAHESAMIVLRTTSQGQIYFDDVSLELKQ